MASKTIIKGSCSSSSQVIRTYDVFVSFRGDTRKSFTDHLFGALRRKGIHFFKDETNLKKGKKILPELIQAIEGSRILIVVFSKKYAFSKWCLRELVKIASYIDHSAKHILPIFYDIDPSEVRYQSGKYDKAFAKHENRYKEDKEKLEEVQRWRDALMQVANLNGWDIRNKSQDTEIGEIVREIIKILGSSFSSLPNDDLVGMESRVEEIKEHLHLGSNNVVRVVGIYGMPGIGKSTLAAALYERISHQYHNHCFIDDVSKTFRESGILGLQKQFLCQALNEKNLEIHHVSAGTQMVRTRLRHARVLIVLDNVDQIDQLDDLALNSTCLGAGSRIIIISTNERMLRMYGVDVAYKVQPLNCNNAVQLFCKKAFKCNYIMSGYEKLVHDALSYAGGHPLAIKVLGSSLFGLDVSNWRSALARLKVTPDKKIMDVLRISFDGLEETEKEIFLDIACFFNGQSEQFLTEVLDFRGFYPEIGLRVLEEKSLITIRFKELIFMHSLLIDLGQHIVKEKSPKHPRKWSRLWAVHDFNKVMSDNMPAKNLEAIVVQDRRWARHETIMRMDNLSKMSNLKLLVLTYFDNFSNRNWNYLGNLHHLSNELGYLIWDGYPFDCLPPSFQPDKLVELSLRNSRITKLWEGRKPLHNLRRLDLSHSKNLIEMPDFGEAQNLEELNLEGCIQLKKIDQSIGLLRKLTVLNLEGCENLVSLSNNILGVHSLEYMSLAGCSKLYSIESLDEPRKVEHLNKLCIPATRIHSESTSSSFFHSRTNKESVSCLLSSSPCFPCMRQLDLSFCNLFLIPDAIGTLCCLERLDLKGNKFATLPSIKELSKLFYLNLEHCKNLKYLSELPSRTDLSLQIYKRSLPRKLHRFTDDKRNGGLLIFNCPDLVQREHCSSIGFSWMMQLLKAAHQLEYFKYSPVHYRIESIIPESQIPRWFNNQHVGMGNLFSIEASSDVIYDNNWIGIACCVAFLVRHEKGTINVMSPQETKRIPLFFSLYFDGNLVMDKSDHMWLFYIPRVQFISSCRLRAMDFDGEKEFEILSQGGWHFEVKNYGYRWVYEQDLEPYNLTSSRKRKCLTIEEHR